MPVEMRPAQIDFSALANLGQIPERLRMRQLRGQFADPNSFMTNGAFDYNKMAQAVGVADPIAGARLYAAGQEADALAGYRQEQLARQNQLTPYQTESLAIQRARLAQGPTPKAPAGYRFNEDGTLEAIEGGPATRIPAETAGRIAMLDTALSDFDKARSVMEGKWGARGAAQSVIGMGDIGRAQRQVKSLIEASLRAMTGAAAPETEVSRYMDLYMPNATDTAETAKQKLDLLVGFAHNAKETITRGRGASSAPVPRPVQTMSVAPDGTMTPTQAPVTTDEPSVMAGAAENPISQGPRPLPRAKSELETGQVYNFPDGRQGLWNGQEFEVLN